MLYSTQGIYEYEICRRSTRDSQTEEPSQPAKRIPAMASTVAGTGIGNPAAVNSASIEAGSIFRRVCASYFSPSSPALSKFAALEKSAPRRSASRKSTASALPDTRARRKSACSKLKLPPERGRGVDRQGGVPALNYLLVCRRFIDKFRWNKHWSSPTVFCSPSWQGMTTVHFVRREVCLEIISPSIRSEFLSPCFLPCAHPLSRLFTA